MPVLQSNRLDNFLYGLLSMVHLYSRLKNLHDDPLMRFSLKRSVVLTNPAIDVIIVANKNAN